MQLRSAMRALHSARHDDDIVITTMGAAREWMILGARETDLVFVPSSMGQATSVALGLALAQPKRRVIVVNGDGSMLMNLGSLVSITAAAPANLVVILADNGVYEVTGSQATPGAAAGRTSGTGVDFAAMARACGFLSVYQYATSAEWTRAIKGVLSAAGPTFVALDVVSVPGTPGPRSPGPAAARAKAFMAAIGNVIGVRRA
jgi:thiamine pyrophosphate-dependent acetolactate synthase large subunit-like protein